MSIKCSPATGLYTFYWSLLNESTMQLATVLSVGAEKCSVSVQRSKSCTAISKIKYMKLVGKKQVWCGEGRNSNSLAIGGVGTDGLQWSKVKI